MTVTPAQIINGKVAVMQSGTDVIPAAFLPSSSSNLSGKNRLVDPLFALWQAAGTSASASGYLADQWYDTLTGTGTFSQVTLSNGLDGLKWLSGAASSNGQIAQPLEQAEVIPLRGQQGTFSVYALASSLSGTMSFVVKYSNSTDALASQTTAVTITTGATFTPTGSLARYSCTFTVPADAIGLMVGVVPSSAQASGVYYEIGMAQLEIGSAATPFDTLPYPLELIRCQRFYEVSYYGAFGGSVYDFFGSYSQASTYTYKWQFQVTKRAVPTLLTISGAWQVGGTIAATKSSILIYNTVLFYMYGGVAGAASAAADSRL